MGILAGHLPAHIRASSRARPPPRRRPRQRGACVSALLPLRHPIFGAISRVPVCRCPTTAARWSRRRPGCRITDESPLPHPAGTAIACAALTSLQVLQSMRALSLSKGRRRWWCLQTPVCVLRGGGVEPPSRRGMPPTSAPRGCGARQLDVLGHGRRVLGVNGREGSRHWAFPRGAPPPPPAAPCSAPRSLLQ